jgi:protein TonB
VVLPWARGDGRPQAPPRQGTIVARLVEAPAPSPDRPATPTVAAVPEAFIAPAAEAATPLPDRAPTPTVPPPASAPAPTVAPPPVPAPEAAARPATPEGGLGLGLDRSPQPLDDVTPVVPPLAGARGGSVVLRLVVSEHGVVESATVVRSSPAGLFDEAALKAFRHARFAPGLRAGIPVRSEVTYEVEFSAQGAGTDASSRTY